MTTQSKEELAKNETLARLFELIEKGKPLPWQADWTTSKGMGGLPYNHNSGRAYTGGNMITLLIAQMALGWKSSAFVTYNGAIRDGGNVIKGEKAKVAVRLATPVKDKSGEQVYNEDGTEKMYYGYFPLFNVEQCEGLSIAPPVVEKPVEWRHAMAEKLLADSGVTILHDGGDRAYYSRNDDSVHLPFKSQFKTASGYYATAAHEIGHASMAPHRLNREVKGKMGSKDYAFEELRAEIFSMIVGSSIGLFRDPEYDPANHAAYVQHYLELFKEEPDALFRAAADAQKIATYYNVEAYAHEPCGPEYDASTAVKPSTARKSSKTRTRTPKPKQEHALQAA
ncbi:ArdC family protein [Pseudoxanthomonas winnipegensis]|uniref:DUF1738 domain-containing protein n=1 Tax=Pseudoxanthomonas winnipegensis TaxID=2480810 RepID=A0A4Q8M3J8_9GAMM|nr:zincin-like metallopeptidase domain-containing protein [Pseudoxanthomonas winnipegensis]TAA41572.1 DUF1738 domain-containing protein [Pseudoxanthomonas winnipegensis]